MNRSCVLTVALLAPSALSAQAPLKAALSGRATTEVALSGPRETGKPAPKALVIKIEYGQPHVRGRDVPVELAKAGTVWRTGANTATSLTTDVDLVIGKTSMPRGAYSLYTLRTADGYLLIINKDTGQSGMDYDQSPTGLLTIAWGKLELSTNWAAK